MRILGLDYGSRTVGVAVSDPPVSYTHLDVYKRQEEEEVEYAIKAGAKAITLGRRILRTETAGMAVLAMLGYLLEE